MASTSAGLSELKEENAQKILEKESEGVDKKSEDLITLEAENDTINPENELHFKVVRTSHHVPWKQFTETNYFKPIFQFMQTIKHRKMKENRKKNQMKFKCNSDCKCKEKVQKYQEARESREFKEKLNDLTSQQMSYVDKIAEKLSKKFHGEKFTTSEKLMCLSIYKTSKVAYEYLNHLIVIPDEIFIKKFNNFIKFDTGITLDTFLRLVEVANEKESIDKIVALMFGIVDLRRHLTYSLKFDKIIGFEDWGESNEWDPLRCIADLLQGKKFAHKALVFAIRGIHSDWFLPVSYIFCNENPKVSKLVELFKDIVECLLMAGFNVVASVCDQRKPFEAALEKLRMETFRKRGSDNPDNAGTILVHDCEIVPMFSPADLLLDFRNNFLASDVEFCLDPKKRPSNWDHDREVQITKNTKKIIASWKHVELAHQRDVNQSNRQVPSLTKETVHAKKLQKFELDLALNVFNAKVSSYLDKLSCETSKDRIQIPAEAYFTSFLLGFLEKLFEALNGEKKEDPRYELKTVLTDDSFHHELFENAKEVLSQMRFVDQKSHKVVEKILCLKNLITSVQGLQVLWKNLRKLDFHFVKTSNLSLEPLDDFATKNAGLTCMRFSRDFKNFFYLDVTV